METGIRVTDGLYTAIGIVCGLLVGFITLSITVDIVMRNLNWGSLPWALEANEYALYVIAILGAPWALRRGVHVRVDAAVKALPGPAAKAVEIVADCIGLVASAILFYYALSVAHTAFIEGARVIKSFIFPEWWIFALMALSAALLVLEFGRRALSRLDGKAVVEAERPL